MPFLHVFRSLDPFLCILMVRIYILSELLQALKLKTSQFWNFTNSSCANFFFWVDKNFRLMGPKTMKYKPEGLEANHNLSQARKSEAFKICVLFLPTDWIERFLCFRVVHFSKSGGKFYFQSAVCIKTTRPALGHATVGFSGFKSYLGDSLLAFRNYIPLVHSQDIRLSPEILSKFW